MKNYKVDLSGQFEISFSDEEKIKKVFLSDEFKEVFYDFEDIEDFCKFISHSLIHAFEGIDDDFIEGIGLFKFNYLDGEKFFICSDEEEKNNFGQIIVKQEMPIAVDFVQKVI